MFTEIILLCQYLTYDLGMLFQATLLLAVATFLNGCQMSPSEQSALLAMSKEDIRALSGNQRATYISTANTSKSKRYYAQFFSRTQEADSLRITISGGTAALSPQYQPGRYHPVVTELSANKCEIIALQSTSVAEHTASLSLCYLNDKLYVDASSTDSHYPMGSMIIPISHRFVSEQRFCQLRTKGNAKLTDACLLVQQHNVMRHNKKPVQQVNRAPKNTSFTPKLRTADLETSTQAASSNSSVEHAANTQS